MNKKEKVALVLGLVAIAIGVWNVNHEILVVWVLVFGLIFIAAMAFGVSCLLRKDELDALEAMNRLYGPTQPLDWPKENWPY